MIDSTIGHYRISKKLGGGGMGVVYLAEDTRLGRNVALKFLPESLLDNSMALERFQREARAASALEHPNICSIHDIGSHDDKPFIVMQFLDGSTLKHRVDGRPLPLDTLLEIGIQIATGLAAAHDNGIVHRDIKPANIFISPDDHARILDFGLAKLADTDTEVSEDAPTANVADLTVPGTAMGTVAYMSPEQARAEQMDARTDLFSLGVVLYEMTTGTPPFGGDSTAVIYSEILDKDPPPPEAANPQVPTELSRIIAKAMEKDRALRYQSAADLAADLKRLRRDSSSGRLAAAQASAQPLQGESPKSGPVVPWIVAAVGVAIGLAGFFWPSSSAPAEAPLLARARLSQLTYSGGVERYPSLSPDGRSLLFTRAEHGNWDIYLKRVGGENPINLTESSQADDTQPVFSPDGEFIAFRSERGNGGIFLMGATGESARPLVEGGFNPAWSPSGDKIVFATEGVTVNPTARTTISQMWIVEVASGERRLLSEGDAVHPNWSPNGQRVAYWGIAGGQRDIWTIPAAGGEPVAVTGDTAVDWNPVWSPDGRRLYFSSNRGGSFNIWAVAIDERSGDVLGEPQPLTAGTASQIGNLTVTADGKRIAYSVLTTLSNIESAAIDPATGRSTGVTTALTQESQRLVDPDPSPDGRWIAYRGYQPHEDLFRLDVDSGDLLRLTNDTHNDRLPRWSPDGKQIYFYSNRSGKYEIWAIDAAGGAPRQLTTTSLDVIYNVVSPGWEPAGLPYDRRGADLGHAASGRRPPTRVAAGSRRVDVLSNRVVPRRAILVWRLSRGRRSQSRNRHPFAADGGV